MKVVEDDSIADVTLAVQMAKDGSRELTRLYCLASTLCDQLVPDMENLPSPDDYTKYFLAESIRDSLVELNEFSMIRRCLEPADESADAPYGPTYVSLNPNNLLSESGEPLFKNPALQKLMKAWDEFNKSQGRCEHPAN